MHIKQITISGFKSYRDATIAGPFSSGHNVVVGRNGSGKSNFFDAVRFVLSDTFSSLRAEERVALLHEGAGASVLSAYVEMLFDNSDGRLPSDRDEVALRRMVGLKKDEYALDRKNVTRTEVFNLLESAGFSRSNPYYIVQQGKVAALCGMSDRQRLDLLKEVAGTRVYDERREESLKIMDETDQRREKITEVVNFIESRLAELESEKEELKAFQRLDKERKALQYTMHVLELEDAKSALEMLDGQHTEQRSRGEELNARLVEIRANIVTAERDVKLLAPEIRRLQNDRDAQDTSRKSAIERIAKLQVDVSEAAQAAEQARELAESTREEMTEVRRQIQEKKKALKPFETQFRKLKQGEDSLSKRGKEIDAQLLSLRVKANRSNQFNTVQQRDAHLKREIREAKKRKNTYTAQITAATKELERLKKAIERNEEKLIARRNELDALRADASGANSNIDDLKAKRDEMHALRKEMWRKTSDINAQMRDVQSRISKLEANKRSILGSGIYQSIQAVMRFSAEDPENLGPNRVFGPILDLIEVDSKFSTAADVTGGTTLTHIVVDNDETAARVVQLMQARRAGRVTIIPLNRVQRNVSRPPTATADAIPLINKISSDPMFMPAVRQVFGRTLVTRTVRVATELSKKHGVDCITLEGDQVNKRGGMSGGFIDASRSRIDAARYLKEAKEEAAKIGPERERLMGAEAEMHANMSRIMGELQRREGMERSSASKIARLTDEVKQLEGYVSNDKESLPRAEERIKDSEQSVGVTEKSIGDMEREVGCALVSGLSEEEEEQMAALKTERDELKGKLEDVRPRRVDLEKEVVGIRTELKNNLERRETQLQRAISNDGNGGTNDGAEMEQRAQATLGKQQDLLKAAETELDGVMEELTNCDKVLVEKSKKYNVLNEQLEHDRDEENKVVKTLEDDRQAVEKRYNRRAMETQRKTESEKNIRELGSLPADFDKFRGHSIGGLMKKLKRTNEKLKKYSHVNKKALEQFITFTEQRDALSRRREELDSGAVAIRSLIDSLDHRKDEDIVRTFKGVSKFFSQVFSELVPGGKASLVMVKSSGRDGGGRGGRGGRSGRGGRGRRRRSGGGQRDDDDDNENENEGDNNNVEMAEAEAVPSRIEYTGVAMKVAFSSTGEAYLLQQLSGGQKSIVALALIFAIQRLDPAPFYLFDEIDANLDATHRQAVANVIRRQANQGTQFVTTTFRPEFVNAGDMWYGVTHKKKVSSVQEVDRDVALTFITDEQPTGGTTRQRRSRR